MTHKIGHLTGSPSFLQPILVALLLLSCGIGEADAKKSPKPPKQDAGAFQREEVMVLNLTKAPKSAKFYLLKNLKANRETQHELQRAISQIEQADANFAKAHRRPDDRTMTATVNRFKAALQTSQQLEEQLNAANAELKADVQSTLVSPK